MLRYIIVITVILISLGGCTSSTSFFSFGTDCVVPLTPGEVKEFNADSQSNSIWVHEEDSLTVRVVTPTNLNQIDRYSHGITLGIYQMEDPNSFVREIATQSGMRRLLLAQDLDSSILQYDVRSLQPRTSVRFDLSRAEKTRYIAIIVGYYSLIADRSVRIIQIPPVRRARSRINPVNWVTSSPSPSPGELDVLVVLGNNQIDNLVVNIRNECGV